MSHLFTFNSVKVRVVIIDGEPWFVAKDVCEILGLDQVSRACDRLREKDRGVTLIPTPSGDQQMVIISEFGLYELVLGSRKEEAKQFKYWICDEVLPQIRKTGSYQPAQYQIPYTEAIAWQWLSSEATLIKTALFRINEKLYYSNYDAYLCGFTHDEINLIAHKDCAKEVANLVGEEIKTSLSKFIKSIPVEESSDYSSFIVSSLADK